MVEPTHLEKYAQVKLDKDPQGSERKFQTSLSCHHLDQNDQPTNPRNLGLHEILAEKFMDSGTTEQGCMIP